MPKGIRNKPDAAPFIVNLPNATPDTSFVFAAGAQPPIDNDHVAPGAELFTPEVIAANAPKAPAAPAEDLPAYAKRIEHAAQPLAVCVITHPDAVDGTVFEGVYAGIRLVNGPEMSALLSDGSAL